MLYRTKLRRLLALLLAAAACIAAVRTAQAEGEPVDLSGVGAAAIAEASALTPILEKSAGEACDVAGLSRLPVLLYVCESMDAGALARDATVTVSEDAARVTGPTAFVEPYERIGAESLLKAGVMILAGDAIYALAEACAGTSGAALAAVNARLEALAISAECLTLTGEGTRLSANDLLKLGAALARSETFLAYSAAYMDEIAHEKGSVTELVNGNRLIRDTQGCFGMATGSSQGAGYSGLFAVRRGETTYLCAVIGAKDSAARFAAARELTEYCFRAYKTTTLARAGDVLAENVPVRGGTIASINLIAGTDAVLLLKQEETYARALELPEFLTAPVPGDVPVGSATFRGADGSIVATVPLYASEAVPAATLWDFVRRVFVNYLHG